MQVSHDSYHPSIEALGQPGKTFVDILYGEMENLYRSLGISKSDIAAETPLSDYGLDPGNLLCVQFYAEDVMSREIPDEDFQGLSSIMDIAKYVGAAQA
jgi:acyl carrier protein